MNNVGHFQEINNLIASYLVGDNIIERDHLIEVLSTTEYQDKLKDSYLYRTLYNKSTQKIDSQTVIELYLTDILPTIKTKLKK